MKKCSKEYMDSFFEKYKIFPFELEEVNEGMYASKEEVTFTARPFKDDIFVQSVIVDDAITSVCAFYTEIDDTDKFDEFAELFINRYGVYVWYDRDYSAIKASISVDEECFDDETDEKDFLIYVLTIPNMICRMAAYTYFAFEDDERSVEDIFAEVTEEEDYLLCPDFINYDVEHNSAIEGMERYFTEHVFLPEMFYNDPKAFIETIINEPEFLESLVEEYLEDNNVEMIQGYEKLRHEILLKDNDCIAIDIRLPEAKETNDCTDIILLYSEKNGPKYYNIELDISNGKKMYYPCSWREDTGHINYGITKNRNEAMKIIKDMISG